MPESPTTINWEWIARRMFVLGDYGFDMQYFEKHFEDEGFLTDTWLEKWYGGLLQDYVVNELHEVDTQLQ